MLLSTNTSRQTEIADSFRSELSAIICTQECSRMYFFSTRDLDFLGHLAKRVYYRSNVDLKNRSQVGLHM